MLEKQIEVLRQFTDFEPEAAIVLGSGLGGLAEKADIHAVVDYSQIPDMPVSTAPLHKGRFVFGTLQGKKVVMMQGRVHLYEGYTPRQVVMPIRLMRLMGASKLILTNASGGINRNFTPGDLMMITDHISCFVKSPLITKNADEIGTRFPDMSNVYSKNMQKTIMKSAIKCGIDLKSGVYVQLTGPQFETPAEIKMMSALGADAVGMSTVAEAVAGVHCGFEVGGISLITNLACGLLDKPLSGEEVEETAQKSAVKFEKLINQIIKDI
ncbi:MAG: purine-nucleoside phosphorylase [Eubacterium sp.]